MEKNIRQKVSEHSEAFKDNLQQWIETSGAVVLVKDENKTNDFLQYMNDFPHLDLNKTDFQKRKRVKNNVPDYNRCIALKCNGDRCSRKQKHDTTYFCGTHLKGANYGTTNQVKPTSKKEKIQLWLQDINGIARYIDRDNNIYCMEDILISKPDPRIIGEYGVRDDQTYFMVQL
jgi:hypothetical protein